MFLKLRSNKGFTILELLIVIAVIAILVGIALPRFKGMKDEGNYAKAKGEMRTLQTAVESYYLHNANAYPANISTVTLGGAVPQIIAVSPPDAFGNGTALYGYGRSPNGNYYAIWSVGVGGTATVTGIDNTGAITGSAGDDIYVTNGTVSSGG